MKRSGFKNPRKPMKRGSLDKALKAYHGFGPRTAPMKRGKGLGPGKKKLAKDAATQAAILSYFHRFGWEEEPGTHKAPCQAGSGVITLVKIFDEHGNLKRFITDANAHHKTPRSELRKAGVKDLDAPHRLLICHYAKHLRFIHQKGQSGRPKDPELARRFRVAETDPANAENGLLIAWGPQDALDLARMK
jgi:hypothetical protein